MSFQVEELDDQNRFRQVLVISYQDLIPFILNNIKTKTSLTLFFWSICFLSLGMAVTIRINIAGYLPASDVVLHSVLGMIILPVLSIPVHELLHVIPYYLSGARKIRVGMDLKQYLFYVTAHRHVTSPVLFRIVAITPFLFISVILTLIIFLLPGLWKWSLSLFLFAHTTMCAGDFALLNFYFINKEKKIYTWDDADKKIAYFYEEIDEERR